MPKIKTHPVPKVGDTVVLNDHGLEQTFGSTFGLAHMKTLQMRITSVDTESMTFPEPTFPVSVDNPDVDHFLIDHNCFDIVPTPVLKCRICGTTKGLRNYPQGPNCDGPDCVAF